MDNIQQYNDFIIFLFNEHMKEYMELKEFKKRTLEQHHIPIPNIQITKNTEDELATTEKPEITILESYKTISMNKKNNSIKSILYTPK